jgi:hypothetical protein
MRHHHGRIDMLHEGLRGLVAGATGTMALDITTYGDMLLRGRAASGVPAKVAGVLAEAIGIEALAGEEESDRADNRRQAAGALLGYATGLGIGALYGLARSQSGRPPVPLAGIVLGLGAMAASDLPIAVTGVSDPRTWTPADWASDLVPHLIYGLVTAMAYEAMTNRSASS